MTPIDTLKRREICFNPSLPDQVPQATALLSGQEGIVVSQGRHRNSIVVEYRVPDHTLAGLEGLLSACGFHLDNSLLQRLKRALIHYCEEVQCDNLKALPQCQKCREIWVKAYEHHPHGDRDDTPEELREYR